VVKVTADGVRMFENGAWGTFHTASSKTSREVFNSLRRVPEEERLVPAETAKKFAKDTNTCLMCGKPLSDDMSVRRGYGPSCATKVGHLRAAW
jgi:hypothetical protein